MVNKCREGILLIPFFLCQIEYKLTATAKNIVPTIALKFKFNLLNRDTPIAKGRIGINIPIHLVIVSNRFSNKAYSPVFRTLFTSQFVGHDSV
jgi:hypothetical protein